MFSLFVFLYSFIFWYLKLSDPHRLVYKQSYMMDVNPTCFCLSFKKKKEKSLLKMLWSNIFIYFFFFFTQWCCCLIPQTLVLLFSSSREAACSALIITKHLSVLNAVTSFIFLSLARPQWLWAMLTTCISVDGRTDQNTYTSQRKKTMQTDGSLMFVFQVW